MRYFTEDDVRRLLPMNEAIEVLRRAFADFAVGRAAHQPRRRLYLDTGSVLHSMTGAWSKYFGTKVYSTNPRHGAWFTVLLYDAETARPLAQLEANHLGQIRTGAVSGLATDLLAPKRAVRVACVGSGFQARSQLLAIAAVRSIEAVSVWSRRTENRERFSAEMAELLDVRVSTAGTAEAAAEGCDVLVTATYSKDPIIEATAVPPGALVLAMGSNHPQRRELPAEMVRSATVIVEDLEACRIEAGDLLLAFDEGDWSRVVELKTLAADPEAVQGRHGVTVFKSVGIGLEDVAVAGWVLEKGS